MNWIKRNYLSVYRKRICRGACIGPLQCPMHVWYVTKCPVRQSWVSSGRNLFLTGHLKETRKKWKKIFFHFTPEESGRNWNKVKVINAIKASIGSHITIHGCGLLSGCEWGFVQRGFVLWVLSVHQLYYVP